MQHGFLDGLNPEDVAILRHAYETTCQALRFAVEFNPDERQADAIRNAVASQVIAIFRTGERRPQKIMQNALAAMPPLQAQWSST